MAAILVVEDDRTVRNILKAALKKWGHAPLCVETIAAGRRMLAEKHEVRMLILDRRLPDGDGLKICRGFKKDPATRSLPIIVLTSLTEFEDELHAYKSGADLFLPKPVDLDRLKHYAAALLDRFPYRGEHPGVFRVGALALEPKQGRVRIGDHEFADLPPRMFDLLYELASRRGRFVSRRALVSKLWGNSVRDKEVDVTVSRLRRRLGPGLSPLILSSRGGGYAVDVGFAPPPR